MEIKNLKTSDVVITDNSRDPSRLADVSELMSSIKKNGLLQPIGVVKKGKTYQILFGHRRYTALKKLGKKTIPAKVYKDLKRSDEIVLTITENEQREDVSIFEQGRLISELINKHKLTKKEVAARLGVSTAYVDSYVYTYNVTPKKFRGKVVYNPSRDKGKRQISLVTATAIARYKKDGVINARQVEELFEEATKNSLSRNEIRVVGDLLKGGLTVKQAVNKNRKSITISVRLPVSETRFKGLVKEFGSRAKVESYLRDVMKSSLAKR